MIINGILCEFYSWPHFGFGMRVIFPLFVLLGGVGWLALAASQKKVDIVACCIATLIAGGGAYWASTMSITGKVFELPVKLHLNGIPFRKVPAGSGFLGEPRNEYGHNPNIRYVDQREVSFDNDMWFSITEITQEQFESVLGEKQNPSIQKRESLPVHNVTLYLARDFCEELNQRVLYWHFRVPTEDEWEYACRAGVSGPICTGTKGDPSNPNDLTRLEHDLHKTAVYGAYSIAEVGTKVPNKWGLYDMQGNAMEICTKEPDQWNLTRVSVRGGSWATTYPSTRIAAKAYIGSSQRNPATGLRIVAVTKEGNAKTEYHTVSSIGNPIKKPHYLKYTDMAFVAVGSLLLLVRMVSRFRSSSWLRLNTLEGGVRHSAWQPMMWFIIWLVGSAGILFNPYLDFIIRGPIWLRQTYMVQKCCLVGLSMLAGLFVMLFYFKVLHPTTKEKRSFGSRFRYIAGDAIIAIVLFLALRPIVELLTLSSQKIITPNIQNYTPNLAGNMMSISDWPGTINQIVLRSQETGLLAYVGPVIIYLALFIGIVFEEVFFRGIIQGHLRLVSGRWTAILVSNLIYTVMILLAMPDQVVPMFAVGLAAGYARELCSSEQRKNGSLFCPIFLRLLLCTRGFVWLHLGAPYMSI